MNDSDAWGKLTAAVGGLVAVIAGAYATVMRARKSRPPDEEPPKLPSGRHVSREEIDAIIRRVGMLEVSHTAYEAHARDCNDERVALRDEHDALERKVTDLDREGIKSLGEIHKALARVEGYIEGEQEGRRSRR